MSYDLFFRTRVPEASVSHEAFCAYFRRRRYYDLQESQAWYSNEDTRIYFVFEYNDQTTEEDAEDETDRSLLPVSFNLNYYRAHVFGLEAEPEVASFVKEFDLTVSDPQTSGMGDGEYSGDGFLRGWNAGNEFAYRAILSRDPMTEVVSYPWRQIEAIWRWNRGSEDRQKQLGDSVFVPRVLFFKVSGRLHTAVVWADGIPILLPEVDLLLVPRQRLAPRRFFRPVVNDMVVFAWQELQTIVNRFRKQQREPPCYELFYEATPADIEQLILSKKPLKEKPEGVAFDQILDAELVDKTRQARA